MIKMNIEIESESEEYLNEFGHCLSGDCAKCDRDGFEDSELNFIDPSDKHGFCDECWKIVQSTGRVD